MFASLDRRNFNIVDLTEKKCLDSFTNHLRMFDDSNFRALKPLFFHFIADRFQSMRLVIYFLLILEN